MKTIKALSLSTAAMVAVMVGGASVNAAEGSGAGTADNNISQGVAENGFEVTDTTSAKANSTAEFTVEAGKLTLDAVPDMQFGATSVKKIIEGNVALPYLNGDVSDAKTTHDGNKTGLVRVSDFRGSDAGWSLSLKLGQFTNINDKTQAPFTGITMDLGVTPTKDTTLVNTKTGLEPGQSFELAATNADKQGSGQNDFTVDATKTKLSIAQNENVKAGTYQADLTWTLANTATTTAAQ